MQEFILVGFVIVLMASLSFIHRLYSKIEKLQKENERLKDMINNELEMTLNEKGEIVSIVQNDDNENQSIELLKVLEL